MTRTHLALLLAAAALIGQQAFAQCDQPPQQGVYTLYRDSPSFPEMRIHVATFDAADGERYNRGNCDIARSLFADRPGIAVRYWCEQGRFKQ